MLGHVQTPGIVTDLGFLTRQLASSWYMSEPQGCSITALLVSILISVTAIIAKTTWEQRYFGLNKLKWVEIGEVCPRFTSSQRHEYIIQMTL
jgi:hypothetical protein